MFESKLNRGKAGGYAPLDGTGKVPLDKLPTIETGSFAITGSNNFKGNQTISGSVTIQNGYLILSSSIPPTEITGSAQNRVGQIALDSDFLYVCSAPFTASIPATTASYTISGGGTTHIYNAQPGIPWEDYGDVYLQVGPSQEGDGTVPPQAFWYWVDDGGIVRQINDSPIWISGGQPSPYPNNSGWICVSSAPVNYSVNNPTLTFYESEPTISNFVPAQNETPSPEIWKKVKLEGTPNYAPFGSGSWDVIATDVTKLDITKSVHLINITDKEDNSHFYLPDGLYDGQVVRFALKGNDTNGPNSVFIWMNNLRTFNGTIQSNTNWSPFYCGEGQGPCRSLATAVYIDGAWNLDTDWWDM